MFNPIPYFEHLPDPRIDRCKLHRLTDIIFITLTAVLAGCDTWNDIEEFAREKESWLRRFIALPQGIPSHDTINRVFSALDPQALQHCFSEWVAAVATISQGQVVAIDGKRMCNSGTDGKAAIVHMVHAWSSANNLLLAQVKTEDKSNEVTAIPTLLGLVDLKGAIVTIDAMGCQRDIAAAIVDKEADYVLAVKDNQGHLLDDIKEAFESPSAKGAATSTQAEAGHGRMERRTCRVLDGREWVCDHKQWKGLRSIVCLTGECTDKKTGKRSIEHRYYISSLSADPALIAGAVREHWSVENGLHWTLDVVFREDYSTKRAGNAAQNFSLIEKMALSILKKDTSKKISLKTKRLKAAWNQNYLQSLLKLI